ncbi:hypothetical protein D8I24_3107 (plasmid) [Cupriavidus necator H850]|uniref:hypothetical protein n=1 Tax=Cupriavidus necator TaxID=106590 RepID=UPI00129E6A09|nr:hypothetical protein [Cupriavidus necator]KAI3602929.1 hypothetical protein D8I24_3107 [Cupriavidus necator H850]
MDLRDIQRMHEQYAQGPITIDVDAAPVAALSAPIRQPAQRPAATTATLFDIFDGKKRLIAMMLLVAAVSLPAGMMLASANKRSNESTSAPPEKAVSAQASIGAIADEGIQWPGTKEIPDEVTSPTSSPVATSASAVLSSAVQAPTVQAPNKVALNKAVPLEARKPEAAARTPSHPAPKPASSAADVKLF